MTDYIDLELVDSGPVDMTVASAGDEVPFATDEIPAHTHDDRYYTKEQTNDLLDEKVDKVTGKDLSTNDYTNADKALVDSALQPNDNVSELTNDAGYTGSLVITASNVTATTFTVDRTLSDVSAAITAGKIIRLIIQTIDGNCYKLTMTQHKATCIALNFETTVLGDNHVFQLSVGSDGSTYEGVIYDKLVNSVSVSSTGTSQEVVQYITIDDVEKKLPVAESEIFWCTNTTSYDEIASAITANKFPIAKIDNKVFVYYATVSNGHLFINTYESTATWAKCLVGGNNWATSITNLEMSSRKASAITGFETSTVNYPNTKAVYDYTHEAVEQKHTHSNKATLDEIEDIDTVVTSGSSHLITSGAVYNVVGNVEAALRAIRGV